MTHQNDEVNKDVFEFADPAEKMEMTGERYVSGITGDIQSEHYHRYLFALQFCRGKRVLDVACGEGYGCNLISQVATEVVGVDIDLNTVAFADRTHATPAVRFVASDATQLPFEDSRFDVVTSFETIEHFAAHEDFLAEIARVLRPDGILVISSPNRTVYTEQNDHHNPFHVRELDRAQFLSALGNQFSEVAILNQRAIHGSVLAVDEAAAAMEGYDSQDGRAFEMADGVPSTHYFVAVAASVRLPELKSSLLFNGRYLAKVREDLQRESMRADQAERQLLLAKTGLTQREADFDRVQAEADRLSDVETQLSLVQAEALRLHNIETLMHQAEMESAGNVDVAKAFSNNAGDWVSQIVVPFRTLGATLRRIQTSSFSANVAAIWRYPMSSDRRKVYRQTKFARASSTPKQLSRRAVNIKAAIRHPFSRLARRTYRDQRQGPLEDGVLTRLVEPFFHARQHDLEGRLFRDQIRNTISPASHGDFVPQSAAQGVVHSDALKLVAYYLPQFHPTPENDEWWGAGFTEWRNVARAFPNFQGHYQPRLPGELGYYDLRVPDIMRRQVEMAKQYGVSAFCFHFYWFGGKRLLEMPIQHFLANDELDLGFSLCWANENWSRRWDGGNNELLIAQEHSPEDDIAFIRYLDRYFQDRRYLKVDGKPVLTVYRPGILPDVKATIARWRREAEKIGYPGLYLIATNSFGFTDYENCGFDALSEFPPHAVQASQLEGELQMSSVRSGGRVYDYASLVEQEMSKPLPTGIVHPGIMPSWDNSARRPHDGHIFHGATPELFGRWLRSAINRARKHPENERLVFVNAWNEWAEGAYLEPDARFGYAWLEEIARSLKAAESRVAIVIHAFYADVFREILEKVDLLPGNFKIFVTTSAELEAEIQDLLVKSCHSFSLRRVENRGRDVLPLLMFFPEVVSEGFEFILKLHTKKSSHRRDGNVWRDDMLDKLLSRSSLDRALSAFAKDSTIGMIGPEGHCVPMKEYIGDNWDRVSEIGSRLQLSADEIASQPFFAGTMFIARSKALEPLVRLEFKATEFEAEAGQKDGTLAHALERVMALSVKAAGMRLASTSDPTREIVTQAHYRYATKK